MTVTGRKAMVPRAFITIVGAVVLMSGVAHAQQGVADPQARLQIARMEGALKQAVINGANQLVQEFRRITPVIDGKPVDTVTVSVEAILVSTPQVEGFPINPHGMVFVVRVPSMNANIVWALSVITGRQRLATRTAARGPVVAQTADGGARPRDAAVPPVAPVETDPLSDSETAYRRFVKDQLMRTMLDGSSGLRIPPTQYLTVAAHSDSPANPLILGNNDPAVIFTIKGSDLDAYHEKRLTSDEALARIVVSEN